MKITIKDIAKEANVSVTTVSFVLNGKHENLTEATIKRVRMVAEKYNYTPNPIAVGLVTKKTYTIGLIVPDIQNLFFSELAKNIEGNLINKGYNLILCNTDDQFDRDIQTINLLKNRNVDGLLIALSSQSMLNNNHKRIFDILNNSKTPFVIIDRDLKEKDYSRVVNDNVFGGYIATTYLIENGHKCIGCITGPIEVSSANERLKGYLSALKEQGIKEDDELIYNGDFHYESGYIGAKKLLKKQISAIFVHNDIMAYGVYKACKELNYKIPDEISIVGYDDLFFSSLLDVPLTSVKQNVEKLSSDICTLILEKINKVNTINQSRIIKPTLTKRKSVTLINK